VGRSYSRPSRGVTHPLKQKRVEEKKLSTIKEEMVTSTPSPLSMNKKRRRRRTTRSSSDPRPYTIRD
jgi:hypothetical protein